MGSLSGILHLLHTKTCYFPGQHCLYLLYRAMTNAFGIHMTTTCPSITTTASATARDFPVGSEVPAPTRGEQLLPTAPTQHPRKASPYLAILLTCLFSCHSSSFSKRAFPSVTHHPRRVSVASLQEEEEERSWAVHRHWLLTVWWLQRAQRCCDSAPDVHHVCM